MRLILVLTCLFLYSFLNAANYYANNSYTGSSDGSFDKPFKNIAEGFDVLQSGDTLFIRGSKNGTAQIYEEPLSLGASTTHGSETQPIVIRGYQNEQVKIIPKYERFTIDTEWWVFEGLTFDMDGKDNDLFRIYGNYLTFRNCVITNGMQDGFDINRADYILIDSCKIYNFTNSSDRDAHGIILNGGEGNVIRNSEIFDCKGDCIQLYKEDQNYNTLIEGNHLYTTLGSGSENAIDFKATKGTIIRNNKMHGFHVSPGSDGVAIKISKDSDNILIENNDIFESNGAIRMSGGDVDNPVIRYNVIHDLHVDEGDTSKYGYGIQFDDVNNVIVLDNTFANIPGPLFWIAEGTTNLDMRNNLFYKSNKFKGTTSDFDGVNQIDYNGWFGCAETVPGVNDVAGDDPLFVDEAGYDYQLMEDSPAIDKGDPASGTDYPGGRTDLGAFEYYPSTDLKQGMGSKPSNFELHQNYPNPFNPSTTISYRLTGSGFVNLTIFNILGSVVDVLVNRFQKAGSYRIIWDVSTVSKSYASGIYFYRLKMGNKAELKRMTLIK